MIRSLPRSVLAAGFTLAACWACTSPSPVAPTRRALDFDPERLRRDVLYLADDARQGRGLGTEGLAQAARYLANGFADAGLDPGGDDGGYLQGFEMPVAIRVGHAALSLDGEALPRGEAFEAFLSSADGEAAGEVVFAGYGITSDDYDDYAGLDVDGRIVLVLDYRPASQTSGGASARFLRRAYKVLNARRHGAAAVLIAPETPSVEGLPGDAGFEPANPTTRSGSVLSLSISRATAERIVAAGGGPSLAERQARIETTGQPASAPLAGVRLAASVRVERDRQRVANVVAVRRGDDPALAREAVVIGAHYDHLGDGRFGSLAPDRRGEVHNGANDNASGAAGLLELARVFGAGPPSRRSLVLVAFTAEEAGLIGSSRYVEAPTFDLADTAAMINLDMIGTPQGGRVVVFGTESSAGFPALVEAEAASLPIQPDLTDGAYGPSDQTSFYAKGVPVLFFFTGTHPTYHTPDDDVGVIDPEGSVEVLRLVERVARRLLDDPTRPEVVQAAVPGHGGTGGGGYGPRLGTIPAFGGEPVRGVRLQGVRPGSPAERAGLRGGDVLVEYDGAPVANLEEFAALLQASRAGQRIELVVVRDGTSIRLEATLGQRR